MLRRRLLLAALLGLALLAGEGARAEAPVTVFAAASLTDSFKDVAAAWVRAGHAAPVLSFGASSTLARQIQQGAPANLFASADEQWMDYLQKAGLVAPDTRVDLLGNRLVLIEPKPDAKPLVIGPGFDLAGVLGAQGRLATGDPAHVPVGIYAKQALTKLGLWGVAEPRLARTDDVRGALLLVERGEAPAGIVYATDAAVSKGVMIAGVFPEDTHVPITYPFAVVHENDTPEARAFLAFLAGPEAKAIFARRGFVTLQ